MTSRDFCYWLQGFFELASPIAINSDQLKTIKNHLKLVEVHEGFTSGTFPALLNILLSFNEDVEELSPSQTTIITGNLASYFKHVIDPQLDGGNAKTSEKYQNIHDEGFSHLKPSKTTVYRC